MLWENSVRVEIDISDVEWGSYYKDEKCKELEKILRSDVQYAECEVKRAHWDDESTDPFHVLDESGEEIVVLERWEVYALSGPELLSYIEVQQKRNQSLNLLETFLDGSFIAIGSMAAGFHIYSFLDQSSSLPMPWSVLLDLLSLFLGILCVLQYRNTAMQKKNADLETARKDPSFLDVLRKLAEIPETENRKKNEFVKRARYVEDTLAGIDS
jgi:hypothetical protein